MMGEDRQAFGLELRALMDHILSCEIFGDGTTSVQQLELWFDSIAPWTMSAAERKF